MHHRGCKKCYLHPLIWSSSWLSSLVEGSSGKAFVTFVLRVHSMQELYYGQTVVCVNDLKQFVAEQDRSWWESPNIMKEIFSDFQRWGNGGSDLSQLFLSSLNLKTSSSTPSSEFQISCSSIISNSYPMAISDLATVFKDLVELATVFKSICLVFSNAKIVQKPFLSFQAAQATAPSKPAPTFRDKESYSELFKPLPKPEPIPTLGGGLRVCWLSYVTVSRLLIPVLGTFRPLSMRTTLNAASIKSLVTVWRSNAAMTGQM